ncbi:hypothetical protein IWQ60_008697 [Tieghemiomyces parasiticus]|uniref:AB hydrolase-1 domain-containing protein n=1 Tax=Tieghemiomyces parasiticus TaxID=78921 RepID=A0A9W8DQZ9_9FUNG|nr:hypothetical protein IWQ60_008697 [Tieghemiomyces parasiticus]
MLLRTPHWPVRALRLGPPSVGRTYTTAPTPVKLAFQRTSSSTPVAARSPPLVILHGLFGSKQNWQSLARALSRDLATPVYSVDLRNHGDSPHAPDMTYEAMAADVARFIEREAGAPAAMVGHSMGGKVAMTLALTRPDLLTRLCVVDMAPLAVPLSATFRTYLEGMRHVDALALDRQSRADQALQPYVPEVDVRQFLLTNYKRTDDRQYRFRLPLDILTQALPDLSHFDASNSPGSPFVKPTLFLAGSRSDYVPSSALPTIRRLFPRAEVKYLDAGHWGRSYGRNT